jgi:DnaD/phage-associated family protein
MYEQNIGLVTPIIADRLVDALERYPETWIEDAIGESVNYNRRNWRYIQRILENWAAEGRNDEADRRGAQGDITREKHLHGKYSHLFRRGDLPDL